MAWKPSYCTTSELESFMRITDSADVAVMTTAISASSRAIDQATGRQFGQSTAAEDRYYDAVWSSRFSKWLIETDDIATTTGLTIHWDSDHDQTYSTAITTYSLRPLNAAPDSKPWTQVLVDTGDVNPGTGHYGHLMDSWLDGQVKVHATFGWSAVPDTIKHATLLQASRLVARRDAPFGISGSAEAGGELRILSKLDADVAVIVKPYYRWWGVY